MRIFILSIFVSFQLGLMAQVDSTNLDTVTEPSLESTEKLSKADSLVAELEKEEKRNQFFYGKSSKNEESDHFWLLDFDHSRNFRVFLLDIGISSYQFNDNINLPAELDEFSLKYPGSYNLNLHLFRHRLPIIKNWLNIDYGLSINFRQYKFENDFRIEPEISELNLIDDGIDYKLNKLRTSYIEIPIAITIKPNRSKVHFTLGFYYSMKIGSNQKLKSEEFGKEVIKDDFNLRSTTTGGLLRFGFGPIEFYTQVGSEGLFRNDIDPRLVPVTFGIAILGF